MKGLANLFMRAKQEAQLKKVKTQGTKNRGKVVQQNKAIKIEPQKM